MMNHCRLFEMDIDNIGDEVEISENDQEDGLKMEILAEEEHFVDQEIQCELINDSDSRMSVKNFENNPEAIYFYTGFDNYEHFKFVFCVLGPVVDHLNAPTCIKDCKLEPIDQFFLLLIKLRLAKEDLELSFLFNISPNTVGSIFNLWIRFLYYQFKEINIFPSEENILQYMSKKFGGLFKSTGVTLLDATEVPVSKLSDVTAQSATFSTYKNKNTRRGVVSYTSDTYGGSTSDRKIFERSPLVTAKGKYFEKNDSIMSDRGVRIQDINDTSDIKVNTPHMQDGKSQLDPEEVVFDDRSIASKMIYMESVIRLAKAYNILVHPLNQNEIEIGSFITYVCFVLSNFRSCIVDKQA